MRVIMGITYCLQGFNTCTMSSVHLWRSTMCGPTQPSFQMIMLPRLQMLVSGTNLLPKRRLGRRTAAAVLKLLRTSQATYTVLGALMIEVISGRVPDPDNHKPICSWASEYLKDKNYGKLVGASLKEHKEDELEAVCRVIQECIDPGPTRRPSMSDVVDKLRAPLGISPEAAAPRLSPLWWAELEPGATVGEVYLVENAV